MVYWKNVAIMIAITFALVGGTTYATRNMVNSACGIKHIITEAGKEVKDIAAEIEAHDTSSN